MSSSHGSFSKVQRTSHSFSPTIENMSVNHGCTGVFVAQQFLHRADIIAIRQQVGSKAVPQCMTANGLGNCTQIYGLSNRFLNAADMQVMSSFHPRSWIF